jgi:hypothetical protein
MFVLYKDICSKIEIEILDFDKLYYFDFYITNIEYVFEISSRTGKMYIIKYLLTKKYKKLILIMIIIMQLDQLLDLDTTKL